MNHKKKFKTSAIILAVLACTSMPLITIPEKAEAANVTVSLSPEYKQSIARNMLNPLNTWRRQSNWYYTPSGSKAWIKAGELPVLKYDYTLEKHAMQRAAEIVLNFDHERPSGTSASGLIGNGYSVIGENLYATTSSMALDPNFVLNKFKEEDSSFKFQAHRRAMLSTGWTDTGRRNLEYNAVGFSCVKYKDCYYWVQIFGKSTGNPNTSATTALNSAKETSMVLNTSVIKRKKSPDFSSVKNTTIDKGTSATLGKVSIGIGLADTWPDAYVDVYEAPTWTSKTPAILTINSNIAYGSAIGKANITAKEPISGISKTVTFTVKEGKVKNGFVYEKNNWYFYKNGSPVTGWYYMTAKDGQSSHWSYFGNNGVLRTGWVLLGKGTNNPDGNNAAHWSYFGSDGWLRMGWQTMGKGTNNPDGNSARHTSYFGDNGWLRTGWQAMGKGTTNPDGNNKYHISYFGSNGWLRTGWIKLGKGTSEPDGNSKQHWSYFGNNGWLVTGTNKINGKNYTFNSSGWLIKPSNP